MWELDIADREKILPVIFELAEQAVTKHGITLRHLRRRDLLEEHQGRLRRGLQRGLEAQLGLRAVLRRRTSSTTPRSCSSSSTATGSWSAEKDGETIGIAITVPDVNQLLKVMNGRVLPLRAGLHFSFARSKHIDRVRVGFLGVKPEYQHTGTAALFYVEHFDMADASRRRSGARWAGSSRPTGP